MARRGRSTTVGKFAKFELDRRVSEIRLLGEALRLEQRLRAEVRDTGRPPTTHPAD